MGGKIKSLLDGGAGRSERVELVGGWEGDGRLLRHRSTGDHKSRPSFVLAFLQQQQQHYANCSIGFCCINQPVGWPAVIAADAAADEREGTGIIVGELGGKSTGHYACRPTTHGGSINYSPPSRSHRAPHSANQLSLFFVRSS